MAYYQAQDRRGADFNYAEPLMGYQDTPNRRRSLGAPLVVLLLCATVGLVVHSSLASRSFPSLTSLALNSFPTVMVADSPLTDVPGGSPQGIKDPQREQGLDDIEDSNDDDDEQVFHTTAVPTTITNAPSSSNDEDEITTIAPLSNSTLAPQEDSPPPSPDAFHFLSCLQRDCKRVMLVLAQANPAGSELLRCLSTSEDRMTATTCWGPLNPQEDSSQDARQTLRVCAVCNGCIPGTVGASECDVLPGTWNVVNNNDDGKSNLPTVSYELPPVISAPPDTPVGKYQADKPAREHVPITNTTTSKRQAAKPWVHIMSGGRANAMKSKHNVTTSVAAEVNPMLNFETTSLARSQKRKASKHGSGKDTSPTPFWAKFAQQPGQPGQNGGTDSPWAKYSSGGNGGGSGSQPATKKQSSGNPWDHFMSGSNFVVTTENFVNLPPASSSLYPYSSGSTGDSKYTSFGDKYSSGGQSPAASSPTSATKTTTGKKTPPPSAPAPMWQKYSSGGSSGGGNPSGTMLFDTDESVLTFDTTNLADSSSKNSHSSTSGSGGSSTFDYSGYISSSGEVRAQPRKKTTTTKKPKPETGHPWGKYTSQTGGAPIAVFDTTQLSAATKQKTKTATTADSQPEAPWARYQKGGSASSSSTSSSGNMWDQYMSGAGGQGTPASPVAAYALSGVEAPATNLAVSPEHSSFTVSKKGSHPSKTSPKSKDEVTQLHRCYQVACNAEAGRAGASGALSCLSNANNKKEGAKCLGGEDPKSPADALRTCMICHKCIDGELDDPRVCDKESSSWNDAGAPYIR